MKKGIRISLIIAGLIISYCLFSILNIYGIDRNIHHYLKSGNEIDEFATDVMPKIDSLPKYNKISYQYYVSDRYSITRTILLVVSYDEKTYEAEKANLNRAYMFLSETVYDEYNSDYIIIPEYEFLVNSFNFRVVEGNGEDYTYFPHTFGMVGTSDETYSIAYLYFYSQSLDEISPPMSEFVQENFPYKW